MADELGGKVMTKFFQLRAKTYSYLIDSGSEDKKSKMHKNCLEATQREDEIRYIEKNKTGIADSIKLIVLKKIIKIL